MSAERQRQALYALAVVGVVVAAWQYFGAAPAVAPTAVVAARRNAVATEMPQTPADVALDALDGGRPGPDEGGRNPFVFGVRQVADDPGARRPVTRRPVADVAPVTLAPPGPPPLPPVPFKFIGLVEGTSSTTRIAVLSDSKGLVVHGTEGTIIDGRFRILAIGTDSLDIAYADGRGRQTLRLSGQ